MATYEFVIDTEGFDRLVKCSHKRCPMKGYISISKAADYYKEKEEQ